MEASKGEILSNILRPVEERRSDVLRRAAQNTEHQKVGYDAYANFMKASTFLTKYTGKGNEASRKSQKTVDSFGNRFFHGDDFQINAVELMVVVNPNIEQMDENQVRAESEKIALSETAASVRIAEGMGLFRAATDAEDIPAAMTVLLAHPDLVVDLKLNPLAKVESLISSQLDSGLLDRLTTQNQELERTIFRFGNIDSLANLDSVIPENDSSGNRDRLTRMRDLNFMVGGFRDQITDNSPRQQIDNIQGRFGELINGIAAESKLNEVDRRKLWDAINSRKDISSDLPAEVPMLRLAEFVGTDLYKELPSRVQNKIRTTLMGKVVAQADYIVNFPNQLGVDMFMDLRIKKLVSAVSPLVSELDPYQDRILGVDLTTIDSQTVEMVGKKLGEKLQLGKKFQTELAVAVRMRQQEVLSKPIVVSEKIKKPAENVSAGGLEPTSKKPSAAYKDFFTPDGELLEQADVGQDEEEDTKVIGSDNLKEVMLVPFDKLGMFGGNWEFVPSDKLTDEVQAELRGLFKVGEVRVKAGEPEGKILFVNTNKYSDKQLDKVHQAVLEAIQKAQSQREDVEVVREAVKQKMVYGYMRIWNQRH